MSSFDEVWDLMAANGCCDARGSAEYRRIAALWDRAGHVVGIARFIYREANSEATVSEANEVAEKVATEHARTQRETINLLLVREKEIVAALRALVDALPANQEASLIYFAGTPLAKACRESVELLRVVDAQKVDG